MFITIPRITIVIPWMWLISEYLTEMNYPLCVPSGPLFALWKIAYNMIESHLARNSKTFACSFVVPFVQSNLTFDRRNWRLSINCFYRGISSTVRRCIEKETGKEFAAKIIDLGAEVGDASSQQMLDATRQEIAILRQVMGHPYISKWRFYTRYECKTTISY